MYNSAGIGYEVTAELARHGAKVYLASRSERKALTAIEKLYAENSKLQKGNLIWLPLDLADLDAVEKAAQTVIEKEERLDILGASILMRRQSKRKRLIVPSQQRWNGCAQLPDNSRWIRSGNGSEVFHPFFNKIMIPS